jgi:hypothetical protein
MEPIVDGLEREFAGRIAFERHNAVTAQGRAVMTALDLRGHPSFAIVAPDGERLWSYAGFIEEDALRPELLKALQPAQ